MKAPLKVDLQTRLNKFLKIPAPPYLPQGEKKSSPDLINLGNFSLKETPDMIASFFEFLSQELICLDDFEGFKKAFSRDITKPQYPKESDPFFKKNPYPEGTQYHKAWHTYFFREAVKNYYQNLSKYNAHENQKKIFYKPFFKDQKGYIQSSEIKLYSTFPDTERGFFDQKKQFYVNENAREKHSYICGETGSGKTTLIETLIYHYVNHTPKTSVVLLDPHGDMAEKIARLKEFRENDRLVYIDFYCKKPIAPDLLPSINPLEIKNRAWDSIEKAVEDLVEVLLEVIKSELSVNMTTLLKNCIYVLILMKNRDLLDLLRFMTDDQNQEYLNFAFKNLKGERLDFFKSDFLNKRTYGQTRQSVKARLQSLFTSTIFKTFLTGKSTLDLEKAINSGKIIVFNLSAGKLSGELSNLLGQFVIAKVKQIAFNRSFLPEKKRVPCHLFIDESHRYISETIESILKETRKYKLYLTFSSQTYLEKMNTNTRRAVADNTAIKMTGNVGVETKKKLCAEMNASESLFKSLQHGRFLYSYRPLPAFIVQTPGFLLSKFGGQKFLMNAEDWDKVRTEQLKKYYRPINPPTPPKGGEFINVQRGFRTPPNLMEDL